MFVKGSLWVNVGWSETSSEKTAFVKRPQEWEVVHLPLATFSGLGTDGC